MKQDNEKPFKKILIPISLGIILSVGFLVFSQTALGERIDFSIRVVDENQTDLSVIT